MNLWRISKHADLSGRGGLLVDGRWHRKGTPVVYCCDHPSTALLEILVHMDKSRIPPDFQLLRLHCPDDLEIFNSESAPKPALTQREIELLERMNSRSISIEVSQTIGTSLLQKRQIPIIRVQSAVMPAAWNYLINPLHPDAAMITVSETFHYPFDSRLLR